MKKFSIYLLGALAMAFTACDDAPESAPLQANPQEPVLEGANVAVENAGILPGPDQTLTLEDYRDQSEIQVFKVLNVTDLPKEAKMVYEFQLGKSEEFDPVETLPVTVSEDGFGYVSPQGWSAAHVNLFGKSPKVKDACYRVAAYAKINGVEYRIGGPDYYVLTGTVKETCMDVGFVIYDSYYLIGNANGWSLEASACEPFKFEHSDADVYDDPVFTGVFEIPADVVAAYNGCFWKIASQGAIEQNSWDLVAGTTVDGSTEMEGQLVEGNSVGAGKLEAAGKYRFTINMEEMTYKIEPITYPEYLCTPGDSNSWQHGASNWIPFVEGKGANVGAAVLHGEFKLTDGESWADDKTYGSGDEAGKLYQPGANLNSGGEGLFWIVANTANMTYQIIPVTSLGAIGGFNSWGAQENFTPSADFRTWTGTITVPADNAEWKIRINDDWSMNYGASNGTTLDNPFPDGGNFNIGGGTFTVTVDFSGHYPVITVK